MILPAPDRFGESGKLTLRNAHSIASEVSGGLVGTAHLFLGVTALEDAVIARQFAAFGVTDVDGIASRVLKALVLGRGGDAEEPDIDDAATKALGLANVYAISLIEAPHILIAVLRDYQGVVAHELNAAGAYVDALSDRLWAMYRQGEWTPDAYGDQAGARFGSMTFGES